jgi:hypothetical protein
MQGDQPNPFLSKVETVKYSKHEEAYALQGLGFLAFAVSSFGALGPTLLRFLSLLADLKLAKFRRFREEFHLEGLTPNDSATARAQYLSLLFSSVCDAIAKATIMRLVGRGHPPAALSFQRVSLQHLAPPPAYSYAGVAAAGLPSSRFPSHSSPVPAT